MKSTKRLLFNGLALVAVLTAGFIGLQDTHNATTDLTADQISQNNEMAPGLVRSQDVIDAKIKRKEQKLAGDKPDTPQNPEARARWEVAQRVGDDGTIPHGALMKAKTQFERLERQFVPGGDKDNGIQTWDWLGPGNIGGRIRAIAIHPDTPNTMWIGGVAGGIWKTTNGGGSWTPMTDFITNLAVTFIVLDPNDPNTLYASTGEGFGNADALRGAGIFKSTDGGTTWAQLASTTGSAFYYVNRLAHHPTDSDHLFAITNGDLYESTDGGVSWTSNFNPIGRGRDVRIHPSDANLMLLGTRSDAYYSTNAGASWTRITDGVNSTLNSPGRVEVAFAPSDTDIMFLGVNTNKGEIWRSIDGGATWTQRNTGNDYMKTQGWYDNVIWVAPDDPDLVVVGGIDLWRSTDGGNSLTRISKWQNYHAGAFSPHADQHIVIAHPDYGTDGNTTVFVGNDGGIQTTGDIEAVAQTSGWSNLANNLGITQFFRGAAAPDGSVIVGGAQDNDHLRYRPGDGVQGWYQAETGDGGYAAINYDDPSVIYSEFIYLEIEKSTNGGDSYTNSASGIGDKSDDTKSLFIAPFTMDPVDPTILYAGGASIWQTTNSAGAWSEFRTPVTGSPLCSAIEVAPTDTDVIWLGYDSGRVDMTSDGGSNWSRVDNNAASIPGRFVTDIAISPVNANQVVVTIGGYETDTVWYTDDAGATWSQISGTAPNDLPEIQVNTVQWDPIQANWLFIGTDLGVLASSDLGQNWSVTALMGSNEGPVNTRVNDLFWQGTLLIAATHGRGMYSTDVFRNNPPVAVCQNVQVDADEDCLGTVTAAMVDDGSYDPDGDDIVLALDPPGPFALGETNVTLTVTDEFGESDSCDAVVTVVDVTPPVVTCPADIQVECSVAGGVPMDDPQLVDFFAAFMAEDNCDPDPDIMNDAPALFVGPCDVSNGETVVTWTATDDSGNAAQCSATVKVVDTTPPEIEVTVNPQVLWPPNHKMVDVEYTVTVSDICDDMPTWELVGITSNEPEDDLGDGTTEPDIMGDDVGTADTSVSLRAERQGMGTGRIYQATFMATDCSGNTAMTMANVYVPHAKSDIGTILSSGSGLQTTQSEISYMVSGASLWGDTVPIDYIGGDGGVNERRTLDPLSAIITNTAGVVPTSAFYVKDVDGDEHPDVLVAFDRRSVMTLAMESQELDGDPVMVLEIGEEKYVVLGMNRIQDVDLDLDLIIGQLRDGEGDDERGLDRGHDVVAVARATGITGTAPNPFNPKTTVSYYVPESGHVELAVFDISGRMINRLVNENVTAGEHSVAWTGVDTRGSRVASGVYFFRMRSGGVVDTKRVVMIK